MSDRALNWLFKIGLVLALLAIGGGLWFYTIGRKPHVLLSAPIKSPDRSPSLHPVGPNEVLLLVGTKATLYDLTRKTDRWSVDLGSIGKPAAPTPPATPAPKAIPPRATPPPAATPVPARPVEEGKPDPLLTARVKRRFAKLEKWAADLNQKRGNLKTPLQIEAFNEEAAKYHAELTAARVEAAPLHAREIAATRATPVSPAPEPGEPEEAVHRDYGNLPRLEIVSDHGGIWIVQGNRVIGLSQADGHLIKNLTVAGNVSTVARGNQHLYVIASLADGRQAQITRIATNDGTPTSLTLPVPPEAPAFTWIENGPRKPSTPELRTVFNANCSALLRLDVRLLEQKITERQTLTGDMVSDFEEADKKTTGGWGNDAAVFAQAIAKDAEREATGGKEYLDESAYEVTLHRPFEEGLPDAHATVHGRPELFSTPSLDLVVAGLELLAFDHSNKKLWQAKLANPISQAPDRFDATGSNSTTPCIEAGDRLYVFDSGYLTALARDTGQPLWRLPAPGIRKLQLDTAGALYVATSTGPRGFSQLLKLDAKTGKILWKVEKYDDCFISGRDIYATRETRNSEDVVNQVFDSSKAIPCRWKIYKLSPRNGEPQWDWFQTRRPLQIDVEHKRVALLFQDELQVLTSIAL
ncbi:MAG: hypothetical protein QOE70_4565 [Chthoniobacter sp.]|jgi:hypothetical protein|nr:hypothetical protein [Chthoniobacter sp.]